MPAELSSPIPAALAHLTPTDPRELQDSDAPHLLAYLATVPTRERPVAAATRWPRSWAWPPPRCWPAPAPLPPLPNGPPRRPSRSLPRSAPAATPPTIPPSPPRPPSAVPLSRLDPDALAGAIGAWLTDRDRAAVVAGAGVRRAVAVDGKTLRGARAPDGDGRPVHLLACMDHATRAVLAQRQVGGAPEEVPAFAPLLAPLDLAEVVVTTDALHTHPDAAEFLVAKKQAHYLFTVKANQPTLLAHCQRLPWHRVPELDRTRDRGHGRIEHRTHRPGGRRGRPGG